MGKKAKYMPELINVNGHIFKQTVFLIHTKDEKGRPRLLTLIPDDHKIELAGGEEFIRVYVSKNMVDK